MKELGSKIIMVIGAISFSILMCMAIPELPKTQPVEYKISQIENFVFLGDSITDWYPINNFFEDYPIVNSGVAGYKTKDVLERLDSMVYIYNPTKVFILIGTNDLNSDESSKEELVENTKQIIENIMEKRPKAEIYLESIYPINRTDDEKIVMTTVGKRTNEDIKDVNNQLESFCLEKGVTYIDMYKELADGNGNLKLDYTRDGLHLTDEGYQVVSEKRKTYMTGNKE